MTYHVDRFHAAVSVLAGDGHIKQRLVTAYESHLEAIRDDDLPDGLRDDFAELRSAMHEVAALNGEGAIRASVRKMSIREASDHAVCVVNLYTEIIRQSETLQDPLPLDDQTDNVPSFLVKSAS